MCQGPSLVMLHGLLMGNLASWYTGAAPVLARTYRVLLYNLGGHGRSERPASGYALADLVADLKALRPRLPVFLVGQSFGGLLALAIAAAHPSPVVGMVLVGSRLPGPGWGDKMAETLAIQGEERDRPIAHAFPSWLGRHNSRKRTRLARSLPAAELRLLPGWTYSVLWEATSEVPRLEEWLAGRTLPPTAAGPAVGGSVW